MNEGDIHRTEGAILGGLAALTANGPLPAVLLVVLIHVLAFGAYGLYAAFTHPMGPPVFGALSGLAVVWILRRVIGIAGLPPRAMRWLTAGMVLCVLVPFESATGLFGRGTAELTGMNADVGIFRLTGVALGPEAREAQELVQEKADCLEAKATGMLDLGNNRSVAYAWSCQRYFLPGDGERACKTFAASKRSFNWENHRAFCSTWVKGPALQPYVMRPLGSYE